MVRQKKKRRRRNSIKFHNWKILQLNPGIQTLSIYEMNDKNKYLSQVEKNKPPHILIYVHNISTHII